MSKKILGLVVFVVVAAAVVGGVFWWKNIRVVVGTADDYVIKNVGDGAQVVENEKAGLSFEVPDGWVIEKIDELEGSVIVYSPETEFTEPKNPPLKRGCVIEASVGYEKTNFEELKEEINDIHFGLGVKSDEFEVVTIKNQRALKNTFDTIDIGKGTVVYILHKNKIYGFSAYTGPNDEEQCLQDFDNFLNKVSYK